MDQTMLYDAWQRYMHRNDLSADLDTVWAFTRSKINDRLMLSDADEVLTNSPNVYLHGGLVYLAELAQDDEQLAREQALFENAVSNYQMGWSLANTIPDPLEVN